MSAQFDRANYPVMLTVPGTVEAAPSLNSYEHAQE
jgi:hypothetical protein